MHALCGAVMRKRITDRMNVKEMLSNSLTFYYVFLFFLFVEDLMAEDENLKEMTKDFMEEDTIFRIIFLIFNVRLVPLIILTLNIVRLGLDFLNKED